MVRLAIASVAILAAALLAAGFWLVGQAQYTENYCFTRAPEPAGVNPEGLSGRPGHLDGPVTIRCEYDEASDVVVTDPLPLTGAVVLATLVMAVAVVSLLWARRSTGNRSPAIPGHAPSR
jgi:hypothetical protein